MQLSIIERKHVDADFHVVYLFLFLQLLSYRLISTPHALVAALFGVLRCVVRAALSCPRNRI
jgi:hypothetical protein